MKLNQLSAIAVFCLFSMHLQAQTKIIAHRGASYDAPENTLAAVNLAWDQQADAVEVDIYLSKDGFLMVNHDKDTKRTGDKTYVIEETDAAELQKVDVGLHKDASFRGETMPVLDDVIATVPEGKRLFIEIKGGVEVLPVLNDVIRKGGKEDQMVIISFDQDAVVEGKKLMPEIPFYWLRGDFREHKLDEVIDIAKANQLDGLDLNHKLIDQAVADRLKKEGLGIYVYTVNDVAIAKKLKALVIDGITTDRPEWLRGKMTGAIK